MQHIEEKINYLNSLGIKYNLDSGRNWILSDLSSYHDIEDENYPLWLIIREMGNHFIVDNNGKPFCKKASTFVHEQFFLSGKISDIFFELQRITNGNFSFKTIQEFKPIDNIDGSRSNEEFWNESNGKNYNPLECKYEICGQVFKFDYHFYEWAPSTLNTEFISLLSETFPEIFLKNNINYFSEEFTTFISAPQTTQEILFKEHNVGLNRKLIPKLKNDVKKNIIHNLPKEKDTPKSVIEIRNEISKSRFESSQLKIEIRELEELKKGKMNELIKLVVFSSFFSAIIIWLWISNYELLDIPIMRNMIYVILGLMVVFVIYCFSHSKIISIKKEINKKKNELLNISK